MMEIECDGTIGDLIVKLRRLRDDGVFWVENDDGERLAKLTTVDEDGSSDQDDHDVVQLTFM